VRGSVVFSVLHVGRFGNIAQIFRIFVYHTLLYSCTYCYYVLYVDLIKKAVLRERDDLYVNSYSQCMVRAFIRASLPTQLSNACGCVDVWMRELKYPVGDVTAIPLGYELVLFMNTYSCTRTAYLV
jgi:hypothetical protein